MIILLFVSFGSRYYVGIRPFVVVKDLEMLKQIMVKQFDNFIDRQVGALFGVWYVCYLEQKQKHHFMCTRYAISNVGWSFQFKVPYILSILFCPLHVSCIQ